MAEQTSKLNLLDLPQEIHLLITSHLIYPDALSLKHTNRHFYSFVYTGLHLKIEWLIQRRQLHLDWPSDNKCDLRSDLRFCRGSVALLMKRRREHQECDSELGGRGCLVLGRDICLEKKKNSHLKEIWRYLKSGIPMWFIVIAVALLAAVISPVGGSPITGKR